MITRPTLKCSFRGIPRINIAWRFHSGHDPAWSRTDFDDSQWEQLRSLLLQGELPRGGWQGQGWFRIRVKASPQVQGQLLGLYLPRFGEAEIYLDGKLISHPVDFKQILEGHEHPVQIRYDNPIQVTFQDGRPHLVAVRYATRYIQFFSRLGYPGGFQLSIADLKRSTTFWHRVRIKAVRLNFFFIGASISLALLHLLLFLFYRDKKENIFYAIAAAAVSLIAYSSTGFVFTDSAPSAIFYMACFGTAVVIACVFLLRFYYEVFATKVPKVYWIFFFGGAIICLFSWTLPKWAYYIFGAFCLIEQIRVLVTALIRRIDGAWIIGIGGGTWALGASLQMLSDFLLIKAPPFSYLFGFLALLGSISVYLARAAAQDKNKLAEQLDQIQKLSETTLEQERRARQDEMARKILEAANARKELKLEEAKKREVVLKELEEAYKTLRTTQAQLVQSEKMASLGQLVAGVAHEVNTPLGALRSASDSLAKAHTKLEKLLEPGTSEQKNNQKRAATLKAIKEATRVISMGSDRIATIVTRLRTFARLDEAEFKQIDIREGIEDALALLGHQMSHKIEVTKTLTEVPKITCYPRQLNQVFLNLLLNACQAIDGEGRITITTKTVENNVHITIQDNGTGIPEPALKRIFDPGYTTRGVGVGAGLGLPICYRIVKEHQGQIEVESKEGTGTTVTIILPTQLKP